MATVNKDFKVKAGLVVEGTTGTINGEDILTKAQADIDYIIGEVGGSGVSTNTPDTLVLRDGDGNFAANEITANLFIGDVDGQAGSVQSLSNHNTDDLAEGTTNKYYTDARVKDVLVNSTKTNIQITEIAGELHITAENGVADSTTDDLTEGSSNKYYSDTLVDNHLSGGDGITYSSGTISADLGDGLGFAGSNSAIAIDRNTVDTWYDAAGAAGDVATDLSTHEQATTAVHGVTGNIVGTSDSQTLTNKTFEGTVGLGSANTNDAYIQTQVDGAGDLTVHAGNDLTLSTSTGDIVLNPDGTTYIGSATAGNEVATHSYVDNAVAGLNWKQAVNLLYDDTTPALSGSGATQLTVDGHATLGDADSGYRILVTGGSDAGIYVYNSTGGSWTLTRADDADAFGELVGAAVYVMEGEQYGSTSWVQGNHYLTNFTGQSWTQFSGQGSVTAGTGITVNGLEVSVDTNVIATQLYADGAVGTHSDYTSNVHGVTGDVVGTSDSQSLSNKTFMGQTNFQSGGGAGGTNNHINVDNSTGKMIVESGYSLDLKSSGEVKLISTGNDIILDADGTSYLGSAASGNEIATQGYVNNQTTDDVSEGSTNQYFTQSRARESFSAGNAISYNSTSGEIAVDASQLDTDDIAEGVTNHYYTDARSQAATADLLTSATLSNITITGDEISGLTITAENGVSGSTTDDLTEGSTNLYFTNTRAVDAISNANIYPTMVDINDYRREEATQQYVSSASTVVAHSFTGNRSVKYLARVVGTVSGTLHSQVTEILLTVDGNSNVAITEFGSIHTTEPALATFTADYNSGSFRLLATTAVAGCEVVVAATLLSWAD